MIQTPRSTRAATVAAGLAAWSLATEPVYSFATTGSVTWPMGEAVVVAPVMVILAFLAWRGGRRALRLVAITAAILAIAEVPSGVFATTDASLWWTLDPRCGIVWCGLLHTLTHWSHVPVLAAIALEVRNVAG